MRVYEALRGHSAVVELLLDNDTTVLDWADDKYNRTPIFWAAKNGHAAVVNLLLETGRVDFNWRDKDFQSPLSWAIMNGHKDVVELLRQAESFEELMLVQALNNKSATCTAWINADTEV